MSLNKDFDDLDTLRKCKLTEFHTKQLHEKETKARLHSTDDIHVNEDITSLDLH